MRDCVVAPRAHGFAGSHRSPLAEPTWRSRLPVRQPRWPGREPARPARLIAAPPAIVARCRGVARAGVYARRSRRRARARRAMTRLSEYLLPTEKQPPADAEAISHKLMVRAGLVRQMGAGMWTWLPAGWRVHQRVVAIIREEMDAIGGQEMLMPVLQPAEPWRKTGRLRDRRAVQADRPQGLGAGAGDDPRGGGHLPRRADRALLPRPAADPLPLPGQGARRAAPARRRAAHARVHHEGLLHASTATRRGWSERYALHVGAYDRIMERTGLRFYRVEADVGMMGGLGAHEYMAPCAAGEDEVVLGEGYAANVEVALTQPGRRAGAATDFTRDGERADDRAGDRGRQHLQARHALLGAARRHATSTRTAPSSRSGWAPTGSARRGSWRRRSSSSPTSTASPGRARWRRSPCTWSRSASPARPSATPPTRLYETLRDGGVEVLYDDRDLGPGREVRRRRAARLPAAADRRAPLAGVGRDRGAGAPRPRGGAGAAAGGEPRAAARGGRAVAEPPVGGRRPRRARRGASAARAAADVRAPVRPRPLGAAAAADAGRQPAAPVDDPQRDRLRRAWR